MGNQCFASTPNQHYSPYLTNLNVSELKDLWQTAKLYKIKKIYQQHAKPYPDDSKQTHIPFQQFVLMFPQFQRFQENQKRRLFQIFDHQNKGFLDWSNFFKSISIFYFASEQILSIYMFMIFDEALSKQLKSFQLSALVQQNQVDLKNYDQIVDIQSQIVQKILSSAQYIRLSEWIQVSKNYFDFNRFRRVFNIFKEEKIQKQLIKNFQDWNHLYNQQTQKYVSYVLSYKWFQTWRIYIQQHYGINIGTCTLKNFTNRTVKTRKTFARKEIKSLNKIASSKTIKQIQYQPTILNNQDEEQNKVVTRNIDFVHSNIGQRPRQIYNNVLQGQFQQALKPQILQNRDYVLVSQKVWSSLQQIYGGGPQFRRTGFDCVQLYPKIVKIYSSLFKNIIDYSSQVIRQVSGYLSIDQLLTRSIELNDQDIKRKKFFYKTIGMSKWQQIKELDLMFSQLSSDIIIYLIYLQGQQAQSFKKSHSKVAKQIVQINVGDYIKYTDPQTKIQKKTVFMGKNIEGKYILHFPKQSYTLDKCLIQSDVIKSCSIYTTQAAPNQLKLKNKCQNQIKGISNSKGLGFINSMILHIFNNKQFKNIISMLKVNQDQNKILYYLMEIYQQLSKRKKVDIKIIRQMIELYLPTYQNFQVSMAEQFLKDFYTQIMFDLSQIQMNKKLQESNKIHIKSTKKCLKCKNEQNDDIQDYCLTLPLSKQTLYIYEIIFVPVSTSLKSTQIKKYGILLSSKATLKNLKQQFEKVCELDNKRPYILAQVYSNKIIKNYNSVQADTTLEKLKLRSGDCLYAFELYVDFNKFIENHYSSNKSLVSKQVKADTFIDCKHNQKGWVFGKVCEYQYLPYTQQTLIKVLHKFSKDQQWQIKYELSDDSVARFPTKCYLNAQQYHFQAIQRYYNQPSNEMQVCNIPFVIVMTNWMRWKQFNYLVYLQLKRFISANYEMKLPQGQDEEQLQNFRLISTKEIKSCKKIVNNVQKSKFKQYLNGQNLPYQIHLVDSQGRCAICFKFLKVKIFKGQSQNYCQGCTLSQSQPISWQIKVADIVVCIDWKNSNSFKTNIVSSHSSLINLTNNKKKSTESLNKCIQNRFKPFVQEQQLLCCNIPQKVQNIQWIQNSPQIIPIFLQRITEQQDGFKVINKSLISYPLKNLKINKNNYNLTGVTSIQGTTRNIKYKTYILMEMLNINNHMPAQQNKSFKNAVSEAWIEYDGQHTRIVNADIIQKLCPLVLFYKKSKQV